MRKETGRFQTAKWWSGSVVERQYVDIFQPGARSCGSQRDLSVRLSVEM